MNKFDNLFKEYSCTHTEKAISLDISNLLTRHLQDNATVEVYKQCFNLIDLTSLNVTDTNADIKALVNKVNNFGSNFPQTPHIAAICVFPSLLSEVTQHLTEQIQIASVAGGFPASQTFIEVKIAETAMAVMEGATEIDVVMPVGKFLEGNYQDVYEELSEIKANCREVQLKVILETGTLPNANAIKKAAILAMASGANFIKTSTGKITTGATPEATYIICHAIKEWFEKTGIKVGFKVAGGIVNVEDAIIHYTLVKEILGVEWLNNTLFRIGASRLANHLLSAIEKKEVTYF
jgi:deoxyribose-phosphate aldolase